MIEYLNGTLDELTPATATVECHGVGYLVNISVNTYTALQGKSQVRVYVHEAIREDAYVLYGFASKQERQLFLLLISVNGVGGNTARTILSAYTAPELCSLIVEGNDKLLKSVKGVGPKTAQRIIVELKDKVPALGIAPMAATDGEDGAPAINQRVYDDAVEALKALGYPPAPSAKVVRAVLKDDPSAMVELVIKRAFKML